MKTDCDPSDIWVDPSGQGIKEERTFAVWVLWTLGLTLGFLYFAAIDMENFRPVSADEVSILAVSFKLAQKGILGSDLYTGYFNAQDHFFVNLPAHHIFQALMFKFAGTSIGSARLVSILFSIILIWSFSWSVWRLYNLGNAVLASTLLVLWPSNLISVPVNLPLLNLARSGRYDMAAVTWIWLSLIFIYIWLVSPSRRTAALLGISLGVASVTHFYGLFLVPLVGSLWMSQRWKSQPKTTYAGFLLSGFGLISIPYLAWVLNNLTDFLGQVTKYAQRAAFASPSFWFLNIIREPMRFKPVWESRTPGTILLIIGIVPVLIYWLRRSRIKARLEDRFVIWAILVFEVQLLLLEQTKAPIYAAPLLPLICLAFAKALLDGYHQIRSRLASQNLLMAFPLIIIGGILGLTLLEGLYAYWLDQKQARQATHYMDLGRQIDSLIVPEAAILGEYRWWWALREHPFLGLNTLYFIALSDYRTSGTIPEIYQLVETAGMDYVVTNNNFVGKLFDDPPGFREQFWEFLTDCSVLVGEINDLTYGVIRVHRLSENLQDCPNSR